MSDGSMQNETNAHASDTRTNGTTSTASTVDASTATSPYWYACKYAPVELLAGFGIKADAVRDTPATFDEAEAVLGPRLCGFSKALVQKTMETDIDHVILSTCCSAMQRSADAIDALGTCDTVDVFPIPHCQDECTQDRLAHEIARYIHTLEARTGASFDLSKCKASFRKSSRPHEPYIGLIGVRTPAWLLDMARELMPIRVVDLTCTGLRDVDVDEIDFSDADAFASTYAEALLDQIPCAYMQNTQTRAHLFQDPNLKAVLYHTVQFCDFYDIECAQRQRIGNVPILHIEDDFTDQGEGQMRTRLGAFAEQLRGMGIGGDPMKGALRDTAGASSSQEGCDSGKSEASKTSRSTNPIHQSDGRDSNRRSSRNDSPQGNLVAGIDSGSTSTDVVIMDEHARIVATAILPTQGSATKSAEASLSEALGQAHIDRERIAKVVATGYGRDAISSQDNVTEITCHAKGAHYLDPSVRCIIDIGGQDSKAIAIDANGAVREFAMNNKCAAGTGRFLEMMAQTLGISLAEMSTLGDEGSQSTTITSTCSVFAESEAISLVAQDVPVADIVAAIDRSVAKRVGALARRVGIADTVMMTGGVTKNVGVVHAIEHAIGHPVATDPMAQLCGAIGAALTAL